MPTTCFPHALQNELKFRTNYRRKMTQGKVRGVTGCSSEMFLKIIRRLCLTRGRKRCGLSLSILRPLYGRRSIVLTASVSVCLSVRQHISGTYAAPNFLCMLHMFVAPSSSGGVAISCVFPVLWMTSYLHIMGHATLLLPFLLCCAYDVMWRWILRLIWVLFCIIRLYIKENRVVMFPGVLGPIL